MSNSNPKSFYNQPDYSAGGSGHAPPPSPQKAWTDLSTPPPPYSPDNTTGSNLEGASDAAYGTVRNSIEQQHHGLLSPSLPRHVSNNDSPAPPPAKRNWNPHSDYQPLPTTTNTTSQQPHDQEAATFSWFATGPARRQNPGCCRKWCKYLIAAILFWLVIYMYCSKIGSLVSPPPPSGGDGSHGCNSHSVQWKDIPSHIDFSDNIELVIQGRVSNGLITVIPLEDRHQGTISSDIQVYPSSLQEKMTFDMQYNDNHNAKLTLHMPPQFEDQDEDSCISVHIEIRLPYAANRLLIHVNNIDIDVQPFVKEVGQVDIETSNGHIQLEHWSGDALTLTTLNGDMKVGKVTSGGSVYLSNANALIYLAQDVDAKKSIRVKNSNGAIDAVGSLRADDTVIVETSNAYIKLAELFADYVSVANANGEIQVDYIEAKSQVLATSSNGPVALFVGGSKNNQVKVINSNAHVNLHMTDEFEGSFVLSTSHGHVDIENKQDVVYQDELEHLKRGYRRERGKGDLVVQTSNADVNVAFDIRK